MGKRGSKTPAVLPLPITSAINAYRHPAEYSNLLSVRPLSIALKYLDMQNRKTVTPHQFPKPSAILLEQPNRHKQAIYKRLLSLSCENERLAKVPIGKLLAMMVVHQEGKEAKEIQRKSRGKDIEEIQTEIQQNLLERSQAEGANATDEDKRIQGHRGRAVDQLRQLRLAKQKIIQCKLYSLDCRHVSSSLLRDHHSLGSGTKKGERLSRRVWLPSFEKKDRSNIEDKSPKLGIIPSTTIHNLHSNDRGCSPRGSYN